MVAYTNAAALVRRGLRRHRGPRRPVLRLRPRARPVRHRQLAVRVRRAGAGRRRRPGAAPTRSASTTTTTSSPPTRRSPLGSGGAADPGPPVRDETLQHPRSVFQVLKRHFARYTPEMVAEVCGIEPAVFEQVAEWVTGNSGRDRTTAWVTRWAGRSTAWARSTSAPLDPADAAGQHRPARRRDHGAARARQHPGLDRRPDAVQPAARLPADAARRPAPLARRLRGRRGRQARASGATSAPTWSACSRPGSATRRSRRTTSGSTRSRRSTATTAPTGRSRT